MFTVHHGNHLETLVDRLAGLVGQPLASPLVPECIIVQSNGMARWLSLQLAQRLGVCANVRYPFPAAFVWEVFRHVLDQVPETSRFDPAVLTWRVMAQLSGLEVCDRFKPLHRWLKNGDDWRRFDLAWRIADSFDQYLVYRPDWILAWEAGRGDDSPDPDERWQAALWRRLMDDGGSHRVHLQRRFFQLADADTLARSHLPRRVALFGIPTLPPVYLQVLQRLSEVLEVHLFLLNPSREYWGDIEPERDIARRAGEEDAEELYLETGNALLASLGKQGRDFIDQVAELPGEWEDSFHDPGQQRRPSLLHCLQADILNLRNRGDEEHPCSPIDPEDLSLQIHACHSPMREVEVLHDRLLHLFETQPDLSPAQVVVMAPEIESYAPLIEAVFATQEGERQIPFAIADRDFRAESPLVDVFFDLLELHRSRFDANRVLTILEVAAVGRRFRIAEDDLPLVHDWVRETGIRWGVDAPGRAALELPATPEHTWRAGLDRLLLGYALPAGNQALFAGILPFDGVEGGEARIMGRLQDFTAALFELQQQLAQDRPVAQWAPLLRGVVEDFIAPTLDEEPQVQALGQALEEMAESARLAGFDQPVSLEVAAANLRRRLQVDPAGRFLTGGVTFCAMVPMRSIPFQVVCLIGMNDGAYPRAQTRLDFDLMGRPGAFRKGDRSRRHDDRYLFLEALLSARRCFYISFVGNSIRDNSPVPPSVLVSELLDGVRRGFYPPGQPDGDGVELILTRHPLQAFSPRYFRPGEPRLFSYSRELCQAAGHRGGQAESRPLFWESLPPPDPQWRTVDLEQLVHFFANPTRFLLRRRLDVHLEEEEGLLETREPFVLDNQARRQLRQRMLELKLTGGDPDQALPLLRGQGLLPHGQVGETILEQERTRVEWFAARLAAFLPPTAPQPIALDLTVGAFRLTGTLTKAGVRGLRDWRLAGVAPRHYLELWIKHLLLNCLAPEAVHLESRWLGEDKVLTLGPVADCYRRLEELLELYWQG
ncbi:MAG: exodeoxyribonuclease V subunit gamma, partial [Candidatus Competibacteraceae bacterium]|nr:exodeoxyribonuclease V subunit gamma [Candidatus Competibacteraceae bacterium]